MNTTEGSRITPIRQCRVRNAQWRRSHRRRRADGGHCRRCRRRPPPRPGTEGRPGTHGASVSAARTRVGQHSDNATVHGAHIMPHWLSTRAARLEYRRRGTWSGPHTAAVRPIRRRRCGRCGGCVRRRGPDRPAIRLRSSHRGAGGSTCRRAGPIGSRPVDDRTRTRRRDTGRRETARRARETGIRISRGRDARRLSDRLRR